MQKSSLMKWLLDSDVSIQYQVYRDLLGEEKLILRNRISREGWAARLLSYQKTNGHWGQGFYQPKWTSTHYTLLDLKNLSISPDILLIRKTIESVCQKMKGPDGGIYPISSEKKSDVCINGMFLNYSKKKKSGREMAFAGETQRPDIF